VTWDEYGAQLDANLLDLQERLHRGSYHPQPVRGVPIPKPDGRVRLLGVTALEDKVVQQALVTLLEPVFEPEFLGFSYGFRPGRSAHDALDALAEAIGRKVDWILDADIEAFFDTIDQRRLQTMLESRVADRRLVRLVMKLVHAGVMVKGQLHERREGTPQGGILSPLLANLYLHEVLDLWAHDWRKRNTTGEVYLVRYADDFVVGVSARAGRTSDAPRDRGEAERVQPEVAPDQDADHPLRPVCLPGQSSRRSAKASDV